MDSFLAVSNVFAGYESFFVLRGASLEVYPGETVAVIGPNGAGKSTLLRTIFGMLETRQGAIEFLGQNITNLSPQKRLRLGISYVPQGRVNFPAMSVDENLNVAGFLLDPRSVESGKAEVMERFPILRKRRRQLAGTMSGGEQQQLEIAMALMLHPRLILIDEPSLGLDPKNVDLVFNTISQLKENRVTTVLVEQNASRALRSADRAYVLEQGQTRMSGTAQSILEDPEVKRLYLGG